MQVEKELAELSPNKDMLLTIGVFDGVHLGHKYLISKLIEQARQQDLLSGVVTFRQHPQEVVAPKTKLPFLTDLVERSNLLRKEGVEGGLYHEYKKNIKNIERGDYDENIEEAYDTSDDHRASADADEAPDFKALIAEWWTSIDPLKEVLTEHVVTIANPLSKPQLLRYGRDPMQTGKDPLRMCIVYPREDRAFGNCLPGPLYVSVSGLGQ